MAGKSRLFRMCSALILLAMTLTLYVLVLPTGRNISGTIKEKEIVITNFTPQLIAEPPNFQSQLIRNKSDETVKHPIIRPVSPNEKWAYAFYVPDAYLLCYALVNVDRLFNVLGTKSTIDVILIANAKSGIGNMCTDCFPSDRLKIFYTPEPGDEYEVGFGYFEPFGLTDYDVVTLVAADGIIMRNLDHLFETKLEDEQVAITVSKPNNVEIFTTTIMVIQPSLDTFRDISMFQQPEEIAKAKSHLKKGVLVKYITNGDVILNYIYEEAYITARKLPSEYTAVDSAFNDSEKTKEAANAYFVSFENRPLEAPRGGKMDDNAVRQAVLSASSSKEVGNPLGIFWRSYFKQCDSLVES